MENSWIPYLAGVVWTAAFTLVAVVHLGHAVVMPGRHRLWHAGHILMAIGMLVMFWPSQPLLGMPARAGIWTCTVVAVLFAFGLVAAWRRGARPGVLWLISVVDFAAMAYMFTMMSAQLVWLSVVAAVWFAAQTIGWATGWLGHILERGGLGDPTPATRPAPQNTSNVERAGQPASDPVAEPTPSAPAAAATPVATPVTTAVRHHIVDGGIRDWSVRITLAVMSAGMGYMILAMQFSTPTMHTMHSM